MNPFRKPAALLTACVALFAVTTAGFAAAQAYPTRPIKIIVPFGAGGATDLAARTLGERMSRDLGQPIVIDNRPGAGSTIGLDAAAKSPNDGYTLVFAGSEMTFNPSLFQKIPFDTAKDFQPISQITQMPSLLVVAADSPFKSATELVAAARAKPGELTYSSGGNGTISHFSAERLKIAAGGLDIRHVPYRTTPEMLTAVLSGQTTFTFITPSSGATQIKAGKLRVLGTTGRTRASQYPQAPTMMELFTPGFELYGWGGLLAPAGVSPAIVARVSDAVGKALADPAVQGALTTAGFEIVGSTPEQFAGLIGKELAEWPAIVKQSGAKID